MELIVTFFIKETNEEVCICIPASSQNRDDVAGKLPPEKQVM